jgi:cytochrome c peroxidase
MKRTAFILLFAATLTASGAQSETNPSGEAWRWTLPEFMPPPRVPVDNAMSEARFQLGRKLFYDTRLSGNGKESCASCHEQRLAFTDGRPVGVGATGQHTPRNSPSIVNAGWRATLTWANPAMVTLEKQMEGPLFGEEPIEMGVNDKNRKEILTRFASDADYRRDFAEAFPGEADPITFGNVIKAISVFERGVVSTSSKYDLYLLALQLRILAISDSLSHHDSVRGSWHDGSFDRDDAGVVGVVAA